MWSMDNQTVFIIFAQPTIVQNTTFINDKP